MQGVKVKNAEHPLLSEMYPDLRKGKWTTGNVMSFRQLKFHNDQLVLIRNTILSILYFRGRRVCK